MQLTSLTLPIIFLISACIYDGRYRRIPNEITYGMLSTGMLFSIFLKSMIGLVNSISGVFMLLIFLSFFNKAFKFGAGDVKLMLACGTWLGKASLYFIIYTFSAVILYNAMLVFKKEGLKKFLTRIKAEMFYGYKESFDAVPGAYFIVLGFLITLFYNS